MPQKAYKPGFLERIRPNLEWEITKKLLEIGGAIVMPFLYTLYLKAHNIPLDWYFIVGMGLVSFVLISVAIWATSRQKRGLAEDEFNLKIEQARSEMRDEVTQMIEAQLKTKEDQNPLPSSSESHAAVAVDPLANSLLPLQQEALLLSMRLLSFIEAQGPPPTPKYTREQIQNISLQESKRLINANDKDFDFASEYYFGGNVAAGGPQTADQLHSLMMARFMLLDPWYEKVRAAYELEFRNDVAKMYNRFVLEGLTDEILNVPIQGKMGRENVRAIASKLWELAYKVREKGVKIENA